MFTSFLLIDAHAPAINAHRRRLAAYGPIELLDVSALRTPGTWHPKITWDGQQWHTQLRPARPRHTHGTIAGSTTDRRLHPTLKGPDIPWLDSTLGPNRAETLLIDHHGQAIESTYSSLLAFDAHTIWTSTHPRALPSTTSPAICAILQRHGWELRHAAEGFDPTWLRSKPVLMLNAFHGAREVRHWGHTPGLPSPVSAHDLNKALWAGAEDVDKLIERNNDPRTQP